MDFDLLITLIGIVVGAMLIYKNIALRKSLLGSFFKKSYNLALLGSVTFFLSFLIDAIGMFGYLPSTLDSIHHLLILVSCSAFFLIALVLPKEINPSLSTNKK